MKPSLSSHDQKSRGAKKLLQLESVKNAFWNRRDHFDFLVQKYGIP